MTIHLAEDSPDQEGGHEAQAEAEGGKPEVFGAVRTPYRKPAHRVNLMNAGSHWQTRFLDRVLVMPQPTTTLNRWFRWSLFALLVLSGVLLALWIGPGMPPVIEPAGGGLF